MPDSITFEGKDVTVELPSEPASINDLANVIIECRKAEDLDVYNFSNCNLRKLLHIAFFLSLQSDEGRFPRLRIVSGNKNDSGLTIKFESPIKFSNVDEIRRIAPIAKNKDFALLVVESEDGELFCHGLTNVGQGGLESLPGRPEISVSWKPSIRIWIEGPGHLFVSAEMPSFEYRAGRVRFLYPALTIVPMIREVTKNISEALHLQAVEAVKDIPNAHKYFNRQYGLSSIVQLTLERILTTCLEMRHGGAFVILPQEDDVPAQYNISCKYNVDKLDLGEDIATYWAKHIEANYARKDGVEAYNKCLRQCYQSKARLFNNIAASAELSAADGCVVLSSRLRILGFGGSILVSEEECKKSNSNFRLSSNHSCEVSDFLGAVGGQRHQSAARLTIMHNDVVVFVISQDRELSVFSADHEGYIRKYSPVDPSFTPDRR